jgi:hypothetical protein
VHVSLGGAGLSRTSPRCCQPSVPGHSAKFLGVGGSPPPHTTNPARQLCLLLSAHLLPAFPAPVCDQELTLGSRLAGSAKAKKGRLDVVLVLVVDSAIVELTDSPGLLPVPVFDQVPVLGRRLAGTTPRRGADTLSMSVSASVLLDLSSAQPSGPTVFASVSASAPG